MVENIYAFMSMFRNFLWFSIVSWRRVVEFPIVFFKRIWNRISEMHDAEAFYHLLDIQRENNINLEKMPHVCAMWTYGGFVIKEFSIVQWMLHNWTGCQWIRGGLSVGILSGKIWIWKSTLFLMDVSSWLGDISRVGDLEKKGEIKGKIARICKGEVVK